MPEITAEITAAPSAPDVTTRARAVRLVVFDVDGVLTDGRLLIGPGGEEFKSFHARDGFGIRLLREEGIEVAVISGRRSEAVTARLSALGVERVLQSRDRKLPALESVLQPLGLGHDACAYVGDDILDLAPMGRCGLAVAVSDAHPRVREAAHYVTRHRGGEGAAREVCELVLEAQGRLEAALGRHARP